MRIDLIDLHRFGRFEQHVLDLTGDAGMHVLYGGNEAGKTTTLDAIAYALFGMPQGRSSENAYGFRFPLPSLRAGLRLRWEDGRELRFLRKRGQKQTILDTETDQPSTELEAGLAALLGGTTKDAWRARHGLSQETLRRGADAILTSNGDAGDALFAAATGITVVRGVLEEVRARRQELLSDGGGKGLIKAQLDAWNDARSRADAARAQAATYDQDVARRAALDRERERLIGEHARLQTRQRTLEGARSGAGLLQQRADLLAQHAAIEAPPRSWGRAQHEQLRASRELLRQHAERSQQLADDVQREQQQLSEVAAEPRLIAAHDTVEALLQRVELVRAAREQLPRLDARYADASESVRAAAAACGHDVTEIAHAQLDEVSRSMPTEAARAGILGAAAAGAEIVQRIDQLEAQLRVARSAVAREQDALQQIGADDDTTLEALARVHAIYARIDVDKHEQERAVLETQRAALEHAARALAGCSLDLAGVRELALPAQARLQQLEQRLQELAGSESRATLELEQSIEHARRAREELGALEREAQVPDPADIQPLRARREQLWQTVRAGLVDPEARPAAVAAAPQFEAAARDADAHADAVMRAGELLGQATKLRSDLEAEAVREQRWREELERVRQEQDTARAEWRELWSVIQVEAQEPAAMQQLIAEIERIRSAATRLDELAASVQATEERIAGGMRELATILGEPVPTVTDTAAFVMLLARADTRRADVERTRVERAELRSRVQSASERVAAHRDELDAARTQLEQWQRRWQDDCVAAGLAAELSIDAARTACEQAAALDAAIAELAAAQRDRELTRTTIETFWSEVAGLLATLEDAADGIDATLPELAIAALRQRIAQHAAAAARQEDLTRRLEERRAEQDALQAAVVEATRQLDALCQAAGGASQERLQQLDEAWAQRSALEQQRLQLDEVLLEQTGLAAAVLAPVCAEHDDEELAVLLAQLQEQLARIDEQLDSLGTERDELVERIGAVETSKVLDEARQQQSNALVRIEELVTEYRSLAIQEQQLLTFMEQQTDSSMGPVLELADTYFVRLTLGRYVALRAMQQGDGALELRAEPADADGDPSKCVAVSQLSEGTRDQLYLALRLATLMHALDAGAEPMPFVVDDILLTFDDDRSAATLSLLGELSERMQVIFLTHHEHLVELAREHVTPSDQLNVITIDDGSRT